MLVGYARVSSTSQDHAIQVKRLEEAGCEKVFSEKASAKGGSLRKQLAETLDYVREGDTFVVTRLDRLARSTVDLHQTAAKLQEKGVNLKVLDQPVDTTNAAGKLFFTILGAFAEFENDIRRERQREGIEAAKKKGTYKPGRPKIPAKKKAEVIKLAQQPGYTREKIAAELGIGVASVYRALREGE